MLKPLNLESIRNWLGRGIIACFTIYLLLRWLKTDYTIGISGFPWWYELIMGLVGWYGITHWNEKMYYELGGRPHSPSLVRAFEWLGIVLGIGFVWLGCVFIYAFGEPPQ